MPRYTIADPDTGADIHCIVDWGMRGSRTYPGEAAHVHSIEVSQGGHLLSSEATTDILSRWDDEALIEAAREIQRDRADDTADHARDLQREDC